MNKVVIAEDWWMSHTGANWEVATCFPSGGGRNPPSGAAPSWTCAPHQGGGRSKPYNQLCLHSSCSDVCSYGLTCVSASGRLCPEKADEGHLHRCIVQQTHRIRQKRPQQQKDGASGVSHRYTGTQNICCINEEEQPQSGLWMFSCD